MGELDHGAKLALRVDPRSIIRLALLRVGEVTPLPQDVISAQRTSDAAFLAELGGDEVVVHVEVEAEPTSDVGQRVARAACALFVATGKPVRSIVYFLHPAADGRRPKSRSVLPIGRRPATLEFDVVAWWTLPPETLLGAGAPGVLPFVVFTRDAGLDHVRRAIRELEALPLEERDRRDLTAALFLLASNREQFPRDLLRAIMPKETAMGWLWDELWEKAQAKAVAEVEAKVAAKVEAKVRAEVRAQARVEEARRSLLVVLRGRLGDDLPVDLSELIEATTSVEALEAAMALAVAARRGQILSRVRKALAVTV